MLSYNWATIVFNKEISDFSFHCVLINKETVATQTNNMYNPKSIFL